MKTTKIESNLCFDNPEIIIEFLKNQSYITGNVKVELTTGSGTFNYIRIGDCWIQK